MTSACTTCLTYLHHPTTARAHTRPLPHAPPSATPHRQRPPNRPNPQRHTYLPTRHASTAHLPHLILLHLGGLARGPCQHWFASSVSALLRGVDHGEDVGAARGCADAPADARFSTSPAPPTTTLPRASRVLYRYTTFNSRTTTARWAWRGRGMTLCIRLPPAIYGALLGLGVPLRAVTWTTVLLGPTFGGHSSTLHCRT